MWSTLVEPFLEFEFLRRALFEAVILSFSFSVVGLFLVTRRLSLIGDTLSHAMLPGVVLAFLIAGPGFFALFFGGWLTAFALVSLAAWMARRRAIEADAVLALFAVFSMAAGVLIASRTRTTTEILHLLFGNILAIDGALLAFSAVIGALTWAAFLGGYRWAFSALVDPTFFQSLRRLDGWKMPLLLALFAANLTIGFAGLGAMMTVGLLVIPSLAGRRMARSPLAIVVASSLFAAVVSVIGIILSYHLEVPSGPAIVAVACAGLLLVHWRPSRRTATVALLALALWAPSARATEVVASFSILGDLVKRVAPSEWAVRTLAGPGEDAHVFEVKSSDLKALKAARVVVVNGLGFEPWMSKALKASRTNATVIDVSEGWTRTGEDPHLWQDPRQTEKMIERIRLGLRQIEPAQAARIDDRAAAFVKELKALHVEIEELFKSIPPDQRRAVTSHDAFGAFAKAYGLELSSPRGWSTEAEPSAKRVATLIRELRRRKARALFVENLSDPKLIEQISRETGVRVGGTLYSDSLTPPSGPAPDYLTMMRFNARQFAEALKTP